MASLRENQRMHQELTAKTAKPAESEGEDSSDDAPHNAKEEVEVTLQGAHDSINPWTKHLLESTVSKNSPPEDESFTRFKKFWEEVNRRKQADREIEDRLEKERGEKNDEGADLEEENEQEEGEEKGEEKKDDSKKEIEELTEEEKEVGKGHKKKPQKSKDKTLKPELDEKRESEDNGEITTKKVSKKKRNKICKKTLGNPGQEAVTIDDLFDQVEIGIKNKVKKKLKKLGVNSKEPWMEVKTKKKHKKVTVAAAPSEIEEFDFTSTSNQENIDEKKERVKTLQDLESIEGENVDKLQEAVQTLKNSGAPSGTSASHKPKLQVDPNKFLQVEAKQLVTALPDSVGEAGEAMDDEEEKESAEDIIREAFADDYLMEEFSCEKAEAIKKDQPGGMSLALPGWGDWTGPNIKMSNRKIKKFRLRVPHAPRKDSNIGHVLYNEKADVHTNLRKSMVTELPYPFKSVKDFEASLRAPVGRQFVPEVVHKKLTAPPIVTKMGTVIQPMTEDELLHYKTTTKDKELENRQNDTRGGRKRKAAGGTNGQQNPKRKVRPGQNKGSR